MELRQLLADDIAMLVYLENCYFDTDYTTITKEYESVLTHKNQYCFIIHENYEIYSFIRFSIGTELCLLSKYSQNIFSTNKIAFIHSIATKEKFRQQGLATKLLNKLYGIMSVNNCSKVISLSRRVKSEEFLFKNGFFKLQNIEKNYLKNNSIRNFCPYCIDNNKSTCDCEKSLFYKII